MDGLNLWMQRRFRRHLREFEQGDGIEFSSEDMLMDDTSAEILGTTLLRSLRIQTFHLVVSAITVTGSTSLSTFLSTSPSLTTVRLTGSFRSHAASGRRCKQVTNNLLTAVQRNPKVTTVHMEQTQLSASVLAKLLETGAEGCAIRKLVLRECLLDIGVKALNAIAKALRESECVQELTLVGLNEELTTKLLESAKNHTNLRSLTLGNLTGSGSDNLRQVLDSSTAVTELVLYRDNKYTAIMSGIRSKSQLQPVLKDLITNRFVRTLKVGGYRLDPTEVDAFRQLFRSDNITLQRLHLRQSIQTSDTLAKLLTSLHRNRSITFLDISDGCLEGPSGARLIKHLLRRNRHITGLDLRQNLLGPEGGRELSEGLCQNKSLHYLNCSSCGLKDPGVAYLVRRSILRHTALVHLVLSDNGIGFAGLKGLFLELAHSTGTKLQTLVLDRNNFGDAGGCAVATMLMSGNSLKMLDISHCGLTGIGFMYIMGGLAGNKSLECLKIEGIDTLSKEFIYAGLNMCVPSFNLKRLQFQAVEVDEAIPEERLNQKQAILLRSFDLNTSLIDFTMPTSILGQESQSQLRYFSARNAILPVFGKNWMESAGAVASYGGVSHDTCASSPNSLWPNILARVNIKFDCGPSLIFLILTSRPDLVAFEPSTLPGTRKRRRSRFGY